MRGIPLLRASLLSMCSALAACGGGPQLGRIGTPLPLPQGAARSACEREGWYELVPTRVQATTVRGGGYVQYHYSQVQEGLGVFGVNEEDPEDLEEVYPAMGEPALALAHQVRIDPVDDANAEGLYWMLGGLAGMGIGIGTAAAISEDSPTGAAVAGVSGLVIGLGGLIGALIVQPSATDELAANARRQLFIPEEDDLGAVARGIERANASRRRRCGGEPLVVVAPGRVGAPALRPPDVAAAHVDLQETPETPEPAEPPAEAPPVTPLSGTDGPPSRAFGPAE